MGKGAGLQTPALPGSVAGETLDRMLGHKARPAGVAGPEIADDVFSQLGRRFRGHHRIRANRAGRKITTAGIATMSGGRQDFSKCWHRDLL